MPGIGLHRLPGIIGRLGTAARRNVGTSGDAVPLLSGDNVFSGLNAFQSLLEKAVISATAATGTVNYDALTQSVLYYTSNASANWTLNIRGDASNSLDSLMSVGQSITVVFLVTQGATAYYNSAVQIDGSAVTPKWQGTSAPSAGTVSSIDAYVYTIMKTGSATFAVFASQTPFG